MYRRSNVQEIADFINLPYDGRNIDVIGVSAYKELVPNTVSFTTDRKIDKKEVALLIVPSDAQIDSSASTVLKCENPRYIFAKVTQFLKKSQDKRIDNLAVTDPTAQLDLDIGIGPFTIIEAGVRVSKGTMIAGHVTLKAGVDIGCECILKTGVVVGEDGFGFGFSSDRTASRINHTGGVIIGNHVEIGTNSVICSGTIKPTKIGNFVKIDDLVFIAHNCQIGEKSIIVAGAELSGSVIIGSRCWIGPNSSIIDGVSLTDDVTVGIGAVITKNITSASKNMGLEALPLRELVALKKRIRFSER